MTQISDDLYLGSAQGPQAANAFAVAGGGVGVGPMGRVFLWDIVPAALNATGFCTSQTVGTGANAVLNGALVSNGVGRADVPRALQMVAAAGNTSNITVFGTDWYGRPQTETRALNGATPVNLTKAFATVTRVLSAGAITTFTLGTRDCFGLPYRVTDVGYVQSVKWAAALPQDAGTFVAADTTDPATATTNDVRGTYVPSSTANGSRRLVMTIAIPAIGSGPTATTVGAIGVTPA